MSQLPSKKKHCAAKFGIVAAVAAALALPMISQHLHAQDEAKAPAVVPAAPAAAKVDPATVIATAGKIQVTAGDFEKFLAALPPQQQAQITSEPDQKRQLADHLVKMKAMLGEAEKRKLDQDPKVKEQLEAVRKQIESQLEEARSRVLVSALFAGMTGDEASDKKFYEDHKAEFGQVKARHILVSTKGSLSDEQAKKKADDIRARVAKGEDFGAIAKTESDDPGSKETGGEYTFGRGVMVPEFEQAAYGLKDKEISQPVKTVHGYHVIQLLERVPGTYEQAKAEIPRKRAEELMNQLLGGAKVEFNESFMNSGQASTAPAPAEEAPEAEKK